MSPEPAGEFVLYAEDRDALAELADRLTELGYPEFQSSFDPTRWRPHSWEYYRLTVFADLRVAIDALALSLPVSGRALDSTLGDSWHVLRRLGIAKERVDGLFHLPSHRLLFAAGLLFFADAPCRDPNVYFGDDSLALLYRLRAMPGRHCVDLCAGSGIQGLRLASTGARVDSVEINPRARWIIAVNAALNRVSGVRVFGGSLFDELPPQQRYDLVTANPPLVPFADDVAYPFVGHGGIDGLVVTRKILAALPERLNKHGRAQIIGMTISDGQALLIHDELRETAARLALDLRITIIAHFPVHNGTKFFDGLVASAAPVAKRSVEAIADRFRDGLTGHGASHLASFFLQAQHGPGKLLYQNLARRPHTGLWSVA